VLHFIWFFKAICRQATSIVEDRIIIRMKGRNTMDATIDAAFQQNEVSIKMNTSYARVGGLASIGGGATMLIGAVLYFSSGTDLWMAVDGGDIVAYLAAVGGVKAQLVANLSFWITGVLMLGIAWAAMARLRTQRPVLVQIAALMAGTAVPLAIISFLTMLAVVVKIAPDTSETSQAIALITGWIGVRSDDLATVLLVGFAPMFMALSARGEWMPTWLVIWGYLAGAVGLLSLLGLYLHGISTLGLLIVPVGIGWMIAVGLVLLRRKE
jgi:hypothetical protein